MDLAGPGEGLALAFEDSGRFVASMYSAFRLTVAGSSSLLPATVAHSDARQPVEEALRRVRQNLDTLQEVHFVNSNERGKAMESSPLPPPQAKQCPTLISSVRSSLLTARQLMHCPVWLILPRPSRRRSPRQSRWDSVRLLAPQHDRGH